MINITKEYNNGYREQEYTIDIENICYKFCVSDYAKIPTELLVLQITNKISDFIHSELSKALNSTSAPFTPYPLDYSVYIPKQKYSKTIARLKAKRKVDNNIWYTQKI